MSSLSVARKIAQTTGSSLSNAVAYVNRVGSDAASTALRRAEDGVTWKVPATVTVGAGGVYGWREQNVRKAEAIANQSNNSVEAFRQILESDLDDAQKAQLIDGFGSDDDDSKGRFEEFLSDIGGGLGGTETTLILMVVVVFVLIYGLNSVSMGAGRGVVR